ncbi:MULTISPECIES: hypothetical protein [unclassified Mycolicibacterium]|uniref:hypothetical protein n=1 Tax=unclassified Mycolicibacterium TaxID=2636767 RepID=UPI001F4C075C|nr:hypothetical protein [Mycolicibacterium sp. YH-1]UNB52327.1 hypothetical protein L0M16_31505 [Mycolicibacterium sp. YH-1]
MPDEVTVEQTVKVEQAENDGGGLSGYGIGSVVLGLVAVVAAVLAFMIWSGHRSDVAERTYQTDVLRTAADWTTVLINMDKDSIDDSLRTLHSGTVGQLNADFESTVEPFKQLVAKLQSQTTGQVESVSIESLYHQLPGPAGAPPQPELSTVASRTDTVLVVATSMSQNAGGTEPRPVRWNLRLGVSDVDGKLLISRLESLR